MPRRKVREPKTPRLFMFLVTYELRGEKALKPYKTIQVVAINETVDQAIKSSTGTPRYRKFANEPGYKWVLLSVKSNGEYKEV